MHTVSETPQFSNLPINPPFDSCNKSSLAEYQPSLDKPWNQTRVNHLLRRMGFGANPEQISSYQNMEPGDVVDQLFSQAQGLEFPEAGNWEDFTEDDYRNNTPAVVEEFNTWKRSWARRMINHGFREKLTLFWHNHFVTQIETYFCLTWMYEYHQILFDYSMGNFKQFVYEIGKTPAMLLYLNGVQNLKGAPNENYARELYELFTLGRDRGYTQEDIKETARALTGYQGLTAFCQPILFLSLTFDNGEKTIFGKTGKWGYDDVHEILFSEKGYLIAQHICRKIYRNFVSPSPNEQIINGLAQIMVDEDFELEPVFKKLFKSEHFFDDAATGSLIKSPLELMIGMFSQIGSEVSDSLLDQALQVSDFAFDQILFSPVDVAGWTGDRTWINTETLPLRWTVSDIFLLSVFTESPETLRIIAKQLSDNSKDPKVVTDSIVQFFTTNGFSSELDQMEALEVFKAEVPQNYFDDELWSLDWDTVPTQTGLLLIQIFRSPEFQLT